MAQSMLENMKGQAVVRKLHAKFAHLKLLLQIQQITTKIVFAMVGNFQSTKLESGRGWIINQSDLKLKAVSFLNHIDLRFLSSKLAFVLLGPLD